MPSLGPGGTYEAGTFEEETDRAWRNVVGIAEEAGFSTGESFGAKIEIQAVAARGS